MTMALSAAVSRGCRVVAINKQSETQKSLGVDCSLEARCTSSCEHAGEHSSAFPSFSAVLLSLFSFTFLLHFQFFFILHLTDFVLLQHHFEEDVSVGPQRF